MDPSQLKETIAQNLRTYEVNGVGGDDLLLSLYSQTPDDQKDLFWNLIGTQISSIWENPSPNRDQIIILENAADFTTRVSIDKKNTSAAQEAFQFLLKDPDALIPKLDGVKLDRTKNPARISEGLRILDALELGDKSLWSAQFDFWVSILGQHAEPEDSLFITNAFIASSRRKMETSGAEDRALQQAFRSALKAQRDDRPSLEVLALLTNYAKAACPERQAECGHSAAKRVRGIFSHICREFTEDTPNRNPLRKIVKIWENNPFNLR